MQFISVQAIAIFNVAQIVNYYRVHESIYGEHKNVRERYTEKKCLELLMENG